MAAVLVGLLALAAQAGAEQTHRAYLYGYPDGTIRPEAEVSRAAFACILLRLAENELPEGARVRFWDVPGTSWAYAAVTRLAGLGLLPFGSDGWFRAGAGLAGRGLCTAQLRLRASADLFRQSCGVASKSLPFRAGFFSACSRFIQAKCVPVWHNILFEETKK